MPIDWARLEASNAKADRVSLLVYQGLDGFPVVDPMLTIASQTAGRFATFTRENSPKVAALRANPKATLTLGHASAGDYTLCKSEIKILSYGDNPELFKEAFESAKSQFIKTADEPGWVLLVPEIQEVVWCSLAGKTVERK